VRKGEARIDVDTRLIFLLALARRYFRLDWHYQFNNDSCDGTTKGMVMSILEIETRHMPGLFKVDDADEKSVHVNEDVDIEKFTWNKTRKAVNHTVAPFFFMACLVLFG